MTAMRWFCSLWTAALLAAPLAAAEKVEVKQEDDGVTVKLDGELFTRYLTRSGAKPVLYPVLGPGGKPMTRAYPLEDARPDERTDHIHQRSLWFTHDDVNGAHFWHENAGHGTIAHRQFVKVQGGEQGVIVTRNDWLNADGQRVCQDERTLTFGGDSDRRWIDFDIVLKATDGDVTFGDTKEGTFGIRVGGTMTVDTKKGGKIVNSEGQTDGAAWGKRAPWVDYHGPVEGDRMGIAVMNHPSSFRFPTYWHVRTYGLFAANPFGVSDFTGDKSQNGAHTIPKGESIALRYRVLLHRGDEQEGQVAEAFEKYAKTQK